MEEKEGWKDGKRQPTTLPSFHDASRFTLYASRFAYIVAKLAEIIHRKINYAHKFIKTQNRREGQEANEENSGAN